MPATQSNDDESMYPPHLLAKMLNNEASLLIESGDYEESVLLLTKALKLTKRDLQENESRTPCQCGCCSFESGLPAEEQYRCKLRINSDEDDCNCDNDNSPRCRKKQRLDDQQQQQQQNQHKYEADAEREDEESDGFVYLRPLFVSRNSIEENHFMGISLVLILLFNLALSHHLMYLRGGGSKSDGEKNFGKAVQLYELAYQSNIEYVQQRPPATTDDDATCHDYSGLRLTMIVSNNLGQIHKAAGDAGKHEMFLNHLLRVVMYVVECRLVGSILNQTEFDGLYRNVSPLMLDDICASAA